MDCSVEYRQKQRDGSTDYSDFTDCDVDLKSVQSVDQTFLPDVVALIFLLEALAKLFSVNRGAAHTDPLAMCAAAPVGRTHSTHGSLKICRNPCPARPAVRHEASSFLSEKRRLRSLRFPSAPF